MRPATLSGTSDLVGSAKARKVVQRGGQLGCDTVTYTGDPVLAAGQSYVYFLVLALDSDGNVTDQLLLLAAWPVGKDGKVQTPHDGDFSLSDLKQALLDGGPPPQPTPNEPTTGPQG
jgi:hypothetical protein